MFGIMVTIIIVVIYRDSNKLTMIPNIHIVFKCIKTKKALFLFRGSGGIKKHLSVNIV